MHSQPSNRKLKSCLLRKTNPFFSFSPGKFDAPSKNGWLDRKSEKLSPPHKRHPSGTYVRLVARETLSLFTEDPSPPSLIRNAFPWNFWKFSSFFFFPSQQSSNINFFHYRKTFPLFMIFLWKSGCTNMPLRGCLCKVEEEERVYLLSGNTFFIWVRIPCVSPNPHSPYCAKSYAG